MFLPGTWQASQTLEGTRRFEGTFSLRKMGHFLEKKGTSLFTAKTLGGNVPPVPRVPTSMVPSQSKSLSSVDQSADTEILLTSLLGN